MEQTGGEHTQTGTTHQSLPWGAITLKKQEKEGHYLTFGTPSSEKTTTFEHFPGTFGQEIIFYSFCLFWPFSTFLKTFYTCKPTQL